MLLNEDRRINKNQIKGNRKDLGYSQFSLRTEKQTLMSTRLDSWRRINKAGHSKLKLQKFHPREGFECQWIQSSPSITKVSTDCSNNSGTAAELESQPLSSKVKMSAACIRPGSILSGFVTSPSALRLCRFQGNECGLVSAHVEEIPSMCFVLDPQTVHSLTCTHSSLKESLRVFIVVVWEFKSDRWILHSLRLGLYFQDLESLRQLNTGLCRWSVPGGLAFPGICGGLLGTWVISHSATALS